MKKQMLFKTKGMNQDLSVSAFNPEFSFENMNLRLSTNEGNTLMSWVNERGTASISLVEGKWNEEDTTSTATVTSILGIPVGTAVISHQLVVFTSGEGGTDYIYIFKFANENKTQMMGKVLYRGSLGFKAVYPIETLVSYESELVQKVYWTDGINQPRVINIVGKIKSNNDNQFDFIPTLKLQETVKVYKIVNSSGEFAPGVIQYAFTYYNKYGQESNIFHTTPLFYISHYDRGGSPEDKVSNSFQITVEHIDENFEYLRIYSIQRTSINATPICKRVQDIEISSMSTKGNPKYKYTIFVDTGKEGDSVDPTELLYKGGEEISAGTMNQKDGTIFLGNISLQRESVKDIQEEINKLFHADRERWFSPTYRYLKGTRVSASSGYQYESQLTAFLSDSAGNTGNTDDKQSVPCGGFKRGDTYRCGIQFQHKSGRWSEPVFIEDIGITNYPSRTQIYTAGNYGGLIKLPTLQANIPASIINRAVAKEYRKIRPLVVFPDPHDRNIVCQGVACPTLTTTNMKEEHNPDAQSSWFFRTYHYGSFQNIDGSTSPIGGLGETLQYINRHVESTDTTDPSYFRRTEIQGHFNDENRFRVYGEITTLHSPDAEFDDQIAATNFNGMSLRKVGSVTINNVFSSIDIQTESPTVSKLGSGPVNKSFNEIGNFGIVSGLFYDDMVVDDDVLDTGRVGAYPYPKQSAKFLIYPWQGTGSLNNDINRPADKGSTTATLKKKVISNLRFANTTLDSSTHNIECSDIKLFNFDEVGVEKLGGSIYQGNIDTSIVPDLTDGVYLCCNSMGATGCYKSETWEASGTWTDGDAETPFTSNEWFKTWSFSSEESKQHGLRKWFYKAGDIDVNAWAWMGDDIGETFVDLVIKKLPIRMKYKSTPHLVFSTTATAASSLFPAQSLYSDKLPIVEITQSVTNRFGGDTEDALKANTWIPCGEAKTIETIAESSSYTVDYLYGDTYFQRYDCLKTYPFTHEDPNQIVEIGSFMLETRVNIDGRYDRNRGQTNNTNMSPQNFNLINPVYSQVDNFFSYKILDKDYYELNNYPNQITWSKTKQNNADIDLWTNVTLASTMELDGDKGKITSLQRLNNQLICFQDTGISQILYNENTQISTTEGIPVEIANSGKVQGKRYLSDTVGCSNKWSICSTPTGLYFMDSIGKNIFLFNGQLNNLSTSLGFNTWCKDNILLTDGWTPKDFEDFHTVYDNKNQEVMFINKDIALAYSEKFGTFTSFYDYGGAPWLCSLDDEVLWITGSEITGSKIWKHQAGEYCNFFGTEDTPNYKPYWMTLVGNPEPQVDKIFTNLEFRACVEGEGEEAEGKYTPYLPFTILETWNEYQHGLANLKNLRGHSAFMHDMGQGVASLKRKFRIWRCDIPRNNMSVSHKTDRMRNPWIYLKLAKQNDTGKRTEIHDAVLTYFG